ncbi:MAG: sodium-dependent bicarbonate transport family permease [Phycisphaeraceae bacterium]|nr:MAG: sodium-dependent bicarbonate transport family permease [Phycisphaeraceae bacterium]
MDLLLGFADPTPSAAPSWLTISPPVLFFFLGAIATLAGSRISIPRAVTKMLSIYLLWAIGFKGGVELAASGLTVEGGRAIGLALALSLLTPVLSYVVCRRLVSSLNAAALAACYGSVSVVTFLTACSVLDQRGTAYGGHMVAAMALMEAPGIVVALVLLRFDRRAREAAGAGRGPGGWKTVLHEALLNGPVVVLLGSLVIGIVTGERGYGVFKPLCTDVFPGVLAFFLLDLGVLAARRLPAIRRTPLAVPVFAIVAPVFFAALAIGSARMLGVSSGDAVLLAVLAASASYIAAPAALRLAVPGADPGLYVSMSLGVTFPFNILAGIPLYSAAVDVLWK